MIKYCSSEYSSILALGPLTLNICHRRVVASRSFRFVDCTMTFESRCRVVASSSGHVLELSVHGVVALSGLMSSTLNFKNWYVVELSRRPVVAPSCCRVAKLSRLRFVALSSGRVGMVSSCRSVRFDVVDFTFLKRVCCRVVTLSVCPSTSCASSRCPSNKLYCTISP